MGRPWACDPNDDKERAKRLELLAERAKRFREELGRRLDGAQREVATSSPLNAAAAAVELIEASDPLLAGIENKRHDDLIRPEAQRHVTAVPETRELEAEANDGARHGHSACSGREGGSPDVNSVQLAIDSMQLAPVFAEMVLKRQWLALKVLLAGEAFLVPCRAARDGVFVFSHMSWHSLGALHSARLQLVASHSDACVQSMQEPIASQLVVMATAELSQQVRKTGHERLEVPLQASSGPHESPRLVGSISVTLSFSSENVQAPRMDGSLEPSGVHLKVWLEDLRLRLPSLNGVFVVLKLGPEQEVVVHVSKHGQRVEEGDLIGRLGFMAVAEHTAWSFDAARAILISGPRPEKLFFQVWAGQELLGLVGVQVPVLHEEAMRDLAQRGRPCVELLAVELPVQATSNGELIGSLRAKIMAEFTSQRREAGPKAVEAESDEGEEGDKLQQRSAQSKGPAQGCIELSAPLSDREAATWFRHMFSHQLSESLRISADRIHICRVDGRTLVFEIAPGPRHEAPPGDALAELGRQLATRDAPIWNTNLAKLLATDPPMMDAQEPRGEQRLAYAPRAAVPLVQDPREPWSATRAELMGSLQQRLFEVVHASGVEVSKAFAVLDTNRDGLVEITDMVALLNHLGLPLPEDVLHLAEKLSNDEGCQVELLDFCRRFSAWQSCRVADTLPPAPVPSAWENLLLPQGARADRCLLMPSFFLYALLDPEGTGRVPPETWHCTARRCLGFSADAAAATYGFCDQHGIGALTYRDFRRYLKRVDELRAQRLPPEACLPIHAFRQDIRASLELADGSSPSEPVNRLAAVAASLERRGRELEHEVTVTGLEELLSDLRLAPEVAAHMVEWQAQSVQASKLSKHGVSHSGSVGIERTKPTSAVDLPWVPLLVAACACTGSKPSRWPSACLPGGWRRLASGSRLCAAPAEPGRSLQFLFALLFHVHVFFAAIGGQLQPAVYRFTDAYRAACSQFRICLLTVALPLLAQALSAEELAGALVAAGVDLKSVDPQDYCMLSTCVQ
ncbi:unnamed protein product [Symbiodinium natans]|uniref:EF-hand domain-containing protein n=1 Tax=Symbiodinium natans TaxID=878477 RepID=A0A812KIF0_9DINO|nr:unnamed protein product [Symbiodinium natans]